MGVRKLRPGCAPQKTRAELQAENEALRRKVASLEEQVTSTQMALCDVYELMAGGADE